MCCWFWSDIGCVLGFDAAGNWKKEPKNRAAVGSISPVRIFGGYVVVNVRINKKIKKGSYTIEAACVMSLILLVVFGVLYLCFFVHNRVWLTSAAYESALAGSMEGVRKDGKTMEAAETRSRELGNIGFFGMEQISSQTTVGKGVKVEYQGNVNQKFFGFDWKIQVEGNSKIICPATWIRKIKAASELMGEIGG